MGQMRPQALISSVLTSHPHSSKRKSEECIVQNQVKIRVLSSLPYDLLFYQLLHHDLRVRLTRTHEYTQRALIT